MTYRNLVFNREAEKWGKPLLDFYKEMNDTADYVLVIGGHNDADYIARGKGTLEQFETGLDSLCRGLIAKYPTAKLAFVTIPVFNAAEKSGIYVWDAQFANCSSKDPTTRLT